MLPSFGQNRTHMGIISNFYRKSSVSGEIVQEISLNSLANGCPFLSEATEMVEKKENLGCFFGKLQKFRILNRSFL